MINKGNINEAEQNLIKNLKRVEKYDARLFDFQTFSLKDYGNENDNSILTKIKIFDKTFLLMGDASSKVEKDFLSEYGITSTILKVGHHGSNTSSSIAFLEKIEPKYAVISAGRNNLYHHPSKETIKNLESLKISILNTQEMGTIEMIINKNKFHILKTLS